MSKDLSRWLRLNGLKDLEILMKNIDFENDLVFKLSQNKDLCYFRQRRVTTKKFDKHFVKVFDSKDKGPRISKLLLVLRP